MSGTVSSAGGRGSDANTISQTGGVWKPRCQVLVGDQGVHNVNVAADTQVDTVLSVMVQKQNWFQADRFQITFSLWMDKGRSYKFWSKFDTMSVLVRIGFEDGNGNTDFFEVFRGFTDKVQIDPIKGIVTISGRNVFGLMVDFKLIKLDTNATIQDVLTGAITAATKPNPFDTGNLDFSGIGDIAGQQYGRIGPTGDKTNTSTGQNSALNPFDQWTNAAQQHGFFYYQEEGKIHFQKTELNGDTGVVLISPQGTFQDGVTKLSPSNCESLTFQHDLNISQWDWYVQGSNYGYTGMATGHQQNHPPENADSDIGKSLPTQSTNRTDEDTLAYAKAMFQEFTLQEWTVTAKVAGPQILRLHLNNLVEVNGTDTIMDGPYMIDSIEHQLDFRRGYTGTVKGRWGPGVAGQTGQGASGP